MTDARFEEVIRLAFETGNPEAIKEAAQLMTKLGDVSEETRAEAAAVLDAVSSKEKAAQAADTYRAVGKSLVDYQRQITETTARVQQLATEVDAADAPTQKQVRALSQARNQLKDLVADQQRELVTLRQVKATLDAAGVSTRSATATQRDLAAASERTATSLRDMVTRLQGEKSAQAEVDRVATAAAKRRENEQRANEAGWRRVARAQDDAAEHAKSATAETTEGLERTTGFVDRLKGALAGLLVYFSFDALLGGIKSILSTGDEFQKFEKQLTSLYGTQERGQQAFDWVKAFTKTTPLQLQDVMKSFITLKNFGIDPTNGSLRAIVDQNAKLGGETERLERITLALGQAFAKGKLQGEEMMQLVEAGVPVYQLLGEVTGKTAGELQKLGAAGKLGSDVLQKFVAQMGKDALGAAAAQVESAGGQFTVAKDNIQQFQDTIAKSGVLNYFRDQLKALNNTIRQMSSDGRLADYAKRISDAIVGVAQAVKGTAGFLLDHAAAVVAVGKAYAAFKIGSIVGEIGIGVARFGQLAASAIGSQTAIGGVASKATILTKILRSLPASLQVAIAVTGFELLVQAGNYIGTLAGKHSAAAKSLEAVQKRVRDEMERQADTYRVVQQQYIQYADTQILTAKQVAALSDQERAAYQTRLEGVQAYLKAKQAEQIRLQAVGRDVSEELGQTQAAYQAANAGTAALAEGARLASEALKDHLSVGAEELRASLAGIGADATTAGTRVQALFASFQADSVTQVGDLALALAAAADESQRADIAVRTGLKSSLNELSSSDLLRFQSASTAAFNAYQVSATQAASVTQTVLEVALDRLGVAADRWGLASTDASRQNIAAFETVAENASASASTIEAAFNKALANATTADEAKSIGDALYTAGDRGRVGFESTERAAVAVQNRLRQLKTAVDPLTDSFAALGIQSKRSLDDAAAAARSAFANIVEAQRNGEASVDDVRAAYEAMARAQLDAAANSEPWEKATVQAALNTQAAILNVTDGLNRMGDSGIDAGDRVARGAGHAQAALDGTAGATHRAADATDRASQSSDDAADSETHYSKAADESAAASKRHAKETESLSYSLGSLSEALIKDLAALNEYAATPDIWRKMWNSVMGQATAQLNDFNARMAVLDKANARFDDMAQRVEALRGRFKYLTDDQLRAEAQAEKTLEDNQKAAKEAAAKKKADQLNASGADAQAIADANRAREDAWANDAKGAPAAATEPAASNRVALDLTLTNAQTSGTPVAMTPIDLQKIANMIVPAVVRQLSVRRASSNR